MNKILLIGAKGQLGQSFQYWAPHFPNFKFYFKDLPELNLLDQNQLKKFFNLNSINIVINCAAYTAVDDAEDEPQNAWQLNVQAIDSLCELSKIFMKFFCFEKLPFGLILDLPTDPYTF